MIKLLTIVAITLLLSAKISAAEIDQQCLLNEEIISYILQQVEKKNPAAIKDLPECLKLDRRLILRATLIDPSQFQNASALLKEDKIFVRRLLKVSPQILQHASPQLKRDKTFMEYATYLNRDALQYADPQLLDNKLFVKKMIEIDSKNYAFASDRLKEIPEFAATAFADNGLLLAFAPQKIKSDKKLVTIAVKSNSSAINFAADELKEDKVLQKLSDKKSSVKKDDLEKFLQENYTEEVRRKNLGWVISHKAKLSKKNKLVERNYVTKWQRNLNFSDEKVGEDLRLITASSRNYPIPWEKDFRKYPDLIRKIEKFFLNHKIARNTIENLTVTDLWKVKKNPLTLLFNLYLLRDSGDADLGSEFSDVTSLTAIAQKHGTGWKMTVVEVIFDSEIKVDVGYKNGHKKYVFWDLYSSDNGDKNPKIIFKVEDRFEEYFEIFEEQLGGKYQMIYRIKPIPHK